MKWLKFDKKSLVYLPLVVSSLFTIILYFLKRNFYLAIVPLFIGALASYCIYLFKGHKSKDSNIKRARKLLNYFQVIGERIEFGEQFLDVAREEVNKVDDQELRERLDNYIGDNQFVTTILSPNYIEGESEKDICSLFHFGLNNTMNNDFKETFAKACLNYEKEIEGGKDIKSKVMNNLDYGFIGLSVVITVVILSSFFKALL